MKFALLFSCLVTVVTGQTGVFTTNQELKDAVARVSGGVDTDGPMSDWNVAAVTDFSYIFNDYNGPDNLNTWDVSKATNMEGMFHTSGFNGIISSWDVSKAINMEVMFYKSGFNGVISDWDVSKATSMQSMFYESGFNGVISDWNVSKATSMNHMFRKSGFNRNISNWDVSRVTTMFTMFYASQFNQDLCAWGPHLAERTVNVGFMFGLSQCDDKTDPDLSVNPVQHLCGATTCVAPTPTTPTVGILGDPHIVTWSGEMYDFHGECDLVLLSSPHFANGLGMDIYVRTKIEVGTVWSYIESAVVRIGNDTLEMQGGSAVTWFWINGEPNKEALDINKPFKTTIGGYNVRVMQKGEKQRKIVIKKDKEEALVIKSYNEIVRVDVRPGSIVDFEGSLGLIGAFPEGKKVARDGATIMDDDDVEFGKHWQVMASEPKLFHNFEGVQAPQACMMPTMTTTKRRLGEGLSRKEAEKACASVENEQWNIACVADVLATSNTDVAGAYENDAASAF